MIQFITALDTNILILLYIVIYLIQLLLTEYLIKVVNRLDSGYKRTNLHYFLPIIAPLVYILIIIEELYDRL